MSVECLESRLALNGSPTFSLALGTISGQVSNVSNGAGVGHIRIQLINANGRVVQNTFTNASGEYSFRVAHVEPYVVREVLPSRFIQVTPTFASAAPTGSYAPGAGSSSWYYGGNIDPAKGPVGPFGWDTIAPAGNLPFESPINLHGPTVDLSRVLSVHYNDAVPKQVVDNGHQFQVQFTSSTADTVTVGGQEFRLAQFHYHGPAESTVNHHTYAMEEHFVNVSASGAETVLAVFLKLGAHNDALDPVLNAAKASLTAPSNTTTVTAPIHFAGLLPTSTRGWFYEGSLTTPPLSQPVNWFVFAQPITLDRAQLAEYQQIAGAGGFLPNARPVQTTDGRVLNEIDNNVNFTGQNLTNVNFAIASRS